MESVKLPGSPFFRINCYGAGIGTDAGPVMFGNDEN